MSRLQKDWRDNTTEHYHRDHQTSSKGAPDNAIQCNTKRVEDLARLSINSKTAVYVEVPSETNLATAAGLEQGYVRICSIR